MRTIFASLLALALTAAANAQPAPTLGQKLFDLGLRRTVAKADGTGRRITGTFNPSVPVGPGSSWDAILARYGFAAIPHGYLRGPEGTDAAILTAVIARFNPWGLPAGYVATEQDRTDALYLASGSTNLWADQIDRLWDQINVPTPSPPACPPCAACPACPSCPACPACPPAPAPIACDSCCPPSPPRPAPCPSVPDRCLQTLELAASWNVMGPGRQSRLAQCLSYLQTLAACLELQRGAELSVDDVAPGQRLAAVESGPDCATLLTRDPEDLALEAAGPEPPAAHCNQEGLEAGDWSGYVVGLTERYREKAAACSR